MTLAAVIALATFRDYGLGWDDYTQSQYGDLLMSLAVSYYTYVTRPLVSPQTNLKISWSLLWPVKRGINIGQLLQEAQ